MPQHVTGAGIHIELQLEPYVTLCSMLLLSNSAHVHLSVSGSTQHLLCACLQACENVGLDQDQLIVTGKGGDLVYGSAEAVERGETPSSFCGHHLAAR